MRGITMSSYARMVRHGLTAGMLLCAVASTPISAQTRTNSPIARWTVTLRDSISAPGRVARQQAAPLNARVGHVYNVTAGGHALKGYVVQATEAQARAIRADPRVEAVEADHVVSLYLPPSRATPGPCSAARRAAG